MAPEIGRYVADSQPAVGDTCIPERLAMHCNRCFVPQCPGSVFIEQFGTRQPLRAVECEQQVAARRMKFRIELERATEARLRFIDPAKLPKCGSQIATR